MEDDGARELVGRVEELLESVEALPDPAGREAAGDVVAALLDMYGEGLARIVDIMASSEAEGLAAAAVEDELVEHLLLLHDLHPIPVEDRVVGALEGVRPYLASHGGNVELVAVEDGVVRVRLEGSCDGCPSSAMTLKLAIEEAVHKAAPEVERVEAENAEPQEEAADGLIQLTVAKGLGGGDATLASSHGPGANGGSAGGGSAGGGDGAWAIAGALPELSNGGTLVKPVGGEAVLFLRLDETFYAYRPTCPACMSSLDGAGLDGDALSCPACGERYDARRAGRSLDAEGHLVPVPLLEDEAGMVKVAVGSPVA